MGKRRYVGSPWLGIALALTLVAAILWAGTPAAAGAGGGYELTWYTIDGGGGTWGTGGGYALVGTAGQPDAGLMAGGSYSMVGGFWAVGLSPYRLYLPLVLRAYP